LPAGQIILVPEDQAADARARIDAALRPATATVRTAQVQA
jgi:hypothetical protein